MGRLNYSARRVEGLKAGQVLARDLRKRIPPGVASKSAARDPYLEIDISGKNLTDEGFAVFIDDLIACLIFRDQEHPQGAVKLAELHLQRNNLTIQALKKLAQVISLSSGDLRELSLSGNKIKVVTREEKVTWKEFLHSFKGCYVLKKLDIGSNPLGPQGLEILSRVYMQSELDFHKTDEGGAQGRRVRPGEISNEAFSTLGLESSKENHRSGVKAPNGQRIKLRALRQTRGRNSALALVEKIVPECDIKRYANTRGLRSIPYLVLSDVSMTNACAVHLSSILSIHRSPQQLLPFLPGGKALSLPDGVAHCKGIIWLPNRGLGPLAEDLLTMTEKSRDWATDAGPEENPEEYFDPLVTPGILHRWDSKRNQMRKKRDIEYTRLTKRVRIDVLRVEGVHSADIWSAALRMMVTCRAILLEDRDHNLVVASNSDLKKQGDNEENIHSDGTHEAGVSEAPQRHTLAEECPLHFLTLQGRSHAAPTPVVARPEVESDDTSPPQSLPSLHLGKSYSYTTAAATSPPPRKENWRFGLPEELWRRIIAEGIGVEDILNQDQQLQIMRYASDWHVLSQELSIRGAADHQQVWKILDSVGCFTYNPQL